MGKFDMNVLVKHFEACILVTVYIFMCLLERITLGSVTLVPSVGLVILAVGIQWRNEAHEERMVFEKEAADGRAALQFAHSGQAVNESSVVMSQMLQSFWANYLCAKMSHKILPILHDAIASNVPDKYDLKITSFDFGTQAPVFKGFSACHNPDGSLAALDSPFYFQSKDLSIKLSGMTPLGLAHIHVHQITMSGEFRFIPVSSENLMTVSFLRSPKLRYQMEGALGRTTRSIRQLSFLTKMVDDGLRKTVTEPRRKMISLDVVPEAGGVKCQGGTIQLAIHGVFGGGLAAEPTVVCMAQVGQVAKTSCTYSTQAEKGAPGAVKPYTMEFTVEGKSAQVVLKIVSTTSDAVVGQAVIDVQHLICGDSTAFWAVAEDGGVLAKRWHKQDAPWSVDLPIELPTSHRPENAEPKYTTTVSKNVPVDPVLQEVMGAKSNAEVAAEIAKRLNSVSDSEEGSSHTGPKMAKLKQLVSKLKPGHSNGSPESPSSDEGIAVDTASRPEPAQLSRVAALDEYPSFGEATLLSPDSLLLSPLITPVMAGPPTSVECRLSPSRSRTRFADEGPSVRLRSASTPQQAHSRSSSADPGPRQHSAGAGFQHSAGAARQQATAESPASSPSGHGRRPSSARKAKGYLLQPDPAQRAYVQVSLMTGDWQLAKTEEAVSASRTPGQRALIVHIKKGHSLKRVANSASVEVGVQYGDVQVATLPVDASAPVWNDTFVIPENVYVAGNALNFRLTARTTNGNKVDLGRTKVHVNGLTEGTVHELKSDLSGTDAGSLSVSLEIQPGSAHSDAVAASVRAFMRSATTRRPELIEVSVERGRNLMACDVSGTSDPYMRMSYAGATYQTPVAYKTLSPEWMTTFHLQRARGLQVLTLQCMDRDRVNDDFMGDLSIDLALLGSAFQGWVPLCNVERGEVFLRVFQCEEAAAEAASAQSADSISAGRVVCRSGYSGTNLASFSTQNRADPEASFRDGAFFSEGPTLNKLQKVQAKINNLLNRSELRQSKSGSDLSPSGRSFSMTSPHAPRSPKKLLQKLKSKIAGSHAHTSRMRSQSLSPTALTDL